MVSNYSLSLPQNLLHRNEIFVLKINNNVINLQGNYDLTDEKEVK